MTTAKLQLRTDDVATSLATARPNQLIIVNNRGAVSRWSGTVSGLGVGTTIGLVLITLVPLGAVAVWTGLAAATGGLLIYTRMGRRCAQVSKLVADNRLDEAEVLAERLLAGMLTSGLRAHVEATIGTVAWRRGELDRAAHWYEQAVRRHEDKPWLRRSPGRWIASFNLAQLHAARGELGAAKALRAATMQAPQGDFFRMEAWFTDLAIAFAADDPTAIEADVHGWVREALATTTAGGHLVLLAWLLRRRGDDEMADHLLEAAEDRLEAWRMDRTFPAVHRWLVANRPR